MSRRAALAAGALAALASGLAGSLLPSLHTGKPRFIHDLFAKVIFPEAPLASLDERVRALAKLRTEEGYMAEARRQPDGSWLLIENHCPICVAAKACQGFCRSELNTFAAVFGNSVVVRREEHLLTGARRCAYRVVEVERKPRNKNRTGSQ